MSDYELLKFVLTPGEKHIGVATVRAWKRIVLRFKALPSEEGGYWFPCGSVKTGIMNGKDKYENWHQLDSTYEHEQMQEFLKQACEPLIAQSQGRVHTPNSVFVAQPVSQPNPNYGSYSQPPEMPPSDPIDPWAGPNF